MPLRGDEIGTLPVLLADLVLERRVVMLDAAFTERRPRPSWPQGSDVIPVKDNLPQLLLELKWLCADPAPVAGTGASDRSFAKGHVSANRNGAVRLFGLRARSSVSTVSTRTLRAVAS